MTEDPRTLLRRYSLQPRKSLGQNFLVDTSAPDRIVACADLTPEDTVLEVGAGLGTLTAALSREAERVIAVETDPQLVDVLHHEMADFENVQIVHGDIMALAPAELLGKSPNSDVSPPLWGPIDEHYHVVANLPYYITNAVIQHLVEADVRPTQMVLTVQLEVARRMTADPGDMSLLGVSVQFYGKADICMRLKRGAFYPVPKVESAVVQIDVYEEPPVPVDDVRRFFNIVRAGFSQRRKQLRNSLASLPVEPQEVETALSLQDIDHRRRAETLSIAEWGKVYEALDPLLG